MLLTISTTHRPATDLGFLLHKHPHRHHVRKQSYGTAHVFYSEVSEERCTAALFVEVDPVGLVRDRKGFTGSGLMDQYVNDRPYAASSLLSTALSDNFASAMAGRSPDRPELVDRPLPLEFTIPVMPCRGGEELLRSLFEPLGYVVAARPLMLDDRFPAWGESAYFEVSLEATIALSVALTHLYALIPVLDNAKHYWVGEDEIDKLLDEASGWLADHPQRDLIARRYLKNRRSLSELALARLVEIDGSGTEEEDAAPATTDGGAAGREDRLEQAMSLNEQRMAKVAAEVAGAGATSVIDLGCGEGRLLKTLLTMPRLQRITGVDVSSRSLDLVADRLHIDRMPKLQSDKLTLLHASLTYRDARFAGYDIATVVEVIEHLDIARLATFARNLFAFARPKTVVITTPNVDYNARYPSLMPGQFRHPDHRFEWSRAAFEDWIAEQARRYDYTARIEGIGEPDPALGSSTQMAVLTLAA